MNPKQKNFVEKISLERMYRLMELAERNFESKPERSRGYIQLMKKIGMRNRVKIPRELREKYCKKCSSLLKPEKNEVRVKEKNLWFKCGNCGEIKKIFLKRKKIVVGLTGGIACGKSEVGKILREKGAEVIDADEIAKEVEERKEIKKRIEKTFGEEILKEGRINHEKLAEIVFSDKKMLLKLNAIVHPLTLREIWSRVKKSTKKIVVVSAPLLIEAGMKGQMDSLIVVSARKELVLQRLKERGLSEAEAEKRISAQMPLKEKEKLADFVIENNNGLKDLREKVLIVWNGLLRDF